MIMRIEGYTCDVCQTQKGVTNHWHILLMDKVESVEIYTASPYDRFKAELVGCAILPWNEDVASRGMGQFELYHICGAECLMKKVAEWVGKGGKATL